jgi:hypothetical protein
MAEDPKQTLRDLEENLKDIENDGLNIVATLGGKLNNALSNNIALAQSLVEKFKVGENITKDLNKSIYEVNKTQKQLNRDYTLQLNLLSTSSAKNKPLIQQKINQINLQKQLNNDLLIELNSLEKLNSQQSLFSSISEKILGTSLSTITSMFTLSGMFALIIESALQFNKASVASGKLLGYGAEKADEIQSNFISIARSTGDVNITSRSLNEAFNQLAESTGYVAEYSEDALKTQIMLTKQFGLTGEEAAGIYKLSVLTGKSSSQVNDEMVGAFVATRNQLKVGIPLKTAIAAAAKVSGQLAANLQNNPSLITKAVVQAAALGTTLEQTANQGERLLDFSSSIENELKAELLTGRQLNLERARAAALAGDQVTLSQELNKNVGSLADYQSMNVLQQKALAEAVGLTADQLSDQLKKQKLAQETGKSLAQITKEEALEAEKRQGIQDKFNASVLKLQDFFGNLISGPVGKFLEMLTNSLNIIKYIGIALGTVYVISKAITITQAILTALKTEEAIATGTTNLLLGAKTAIMSTQLGIAAAAATAAVIANPTLGIVGLVAAAGVGALIYSQMKDGIIGPGGETVVSGPKGLIQLNKDDSIVAGTNLFDKGNNNQSLSPSIDLTPMITAINEVKSAVDRLYSKNTTISMDGKAVGTTLTQGSYKLA